MKKVVSIICMLLFSIGALAQGYKNPVLPGFHADPSVCRVGARHFTGVMLGVFAQGESTNGVADFDWFEYK